MNVAILSRMSTQDLAPGKICVTSPVGTLSPHWEDIWAGGDQERGETRIILHSEEKLISHGEEGGRGRFIGFQTGPGSRYTWWSSYMVSVLLRDEQRKVGRGGVLGCDFMFVQMLEWISATSPHNTLFISAPAPHLNSLLRDDERFFSVFSVWRMVR